MADIPSGSVAASTAPCRPSASRCASVTTSPPAVVVVEVLAWPSWIEHTFGTWDGQIDTDNLWKTPSTPETPSGAKVR